VPTIVTHALVVVCAGSAVPARRRLPRIFWFVLAGLAVLPDLDVVAFAVGIPYGSPWGHRGASHSPAAAVVVGLIAAALTRHRVPLPWPALAVCYAAAMASHGVLDAFTDGGSGVAFLFPFDDTRYFAPWRPIRVSPIGLDILSHWGWRVIESEARWLWLPSAALVVVGALLRRARR
jgi:inner membrane protein